MLFLVETVDLIDQHDAVLHHHTDHAQQAHDGHEGEWLTEYQQGWHNATEHEWQA